MTRAVLFLALFTGIIALMTDEYDAAYGNEPDVKRRQYTVWVFKQVNGKWVKQEDRTLVTDDKYKAAAYDKAVKSYPGWTATANTPISPQSLTQRKRPPSPIAKYSDLERMNPGYYSVRIKGINKDNTVTVTLEPTGRELTIPLNYVGRIRSFDAKATEAASLVGRRVLLCLAPYESRAELLDATLATPGAPLYAISADLLSDQQSETKELRKFLDKHQVGPNRSEELLGKLMFSSRFTQSGGFRLVIGRLSWEFDIKWEDIRSDVEIMKDGYFIAVARMDEPLVFRHRECLPLDLKVPSGTELLVVEDLQLQNAKLGDIAKLRLPVSDYALKQLEKGSANLVVMMLPPKTVWPSVLDAKKRDQSLDIPFTRLEYNILEFAVPPGEYGIHCFYPEHHRYVQRITVVAGETRTLPKVELPLVGYAVAKFCKFDGARFDPAKAEETYLVTHRYSFPTPNYLTSWFGNLAGIEFGPQLGRPLSWLSRDEKGDIVCCFLQGSEVKIADLGKGELKDFVDLREPDVTWKKEEELFVDKKRQADFSFDKALDDGPPTIVGKCVLIRKGRVYRFDRNEEKYLVEIVGVTNDLREYAEMAGLLNLYGLQEKEESKP